MNMLLSMRSVLDVCGCFPTGRHYPGIAERMQRVLQDVAGLAAGYEARTRWAQAKLAIIDFETTGLSPETDRVIEVGIACFEGGRLSFMRNWLINPGMPIPEESRAVHNITDEELAHAPSFHEVADELAQALRDHIPVAYNAAFDRRFLHAELDRLLAARHCAGKRAPCSQRCTGCGSRAARVSRAYAQQLRRAHQPASALRRPPGSRLQPFASQITHVRLAQDACARCAV
jgi:hypothetical protein